MKRISKKHKSEKVKREALEQLRETRALFEGQYPDLFDKLKTLIETSQAAPVVPELDKDESVEKIDREKNLATVLQFLELKPHSDSLKQELKKLLS